MKKTLNLLLISVILFSLFAVTDVQASGTPFNAMGKVTDRYGNAVDGATVTMVDNNYNVVAKTKSDVNGNFEFVSVSVESGTVKVLVSYTDESGKTYSTKGEFSHWFNAVGQQFVNGTDTQLVDYPPPSYGYVSGTIQTGTNVGDRSLDGVVYVISGEVKYYKFAKKTTGTGGFLFYLPPGTYTIYAQHAENGMIYESQRKSINVVGNLLTQVTPTIIVVPLTTPSSNPDPSELPTIDQFNKINGTVRTKDGKAVEGAIVNLYQKSDNGTTFLKREGLTTKTDANGYFEFDYVGVTSDDQQEIQTRKDILVKIDYTDNTGAVQTYTSDSRPLYYPNLIMGFGMEQAARNVMFGDKNGNIYLPFARAGWVSLTSDPPGAAVSVDDHPLAGPDGKQLVTPCTAYIDAGTHKITLSMDGYVDKAGTIEMQSNTQHDPVFMSLDRPVVPPIVTLIVAVIILLIVAVLIILLLASRRQMILAPFAGVIASARHMYSDRMASREITKAHKAEVAEQRKAENQQALTARLQAKARDEVHQFEGKIASRVKREPASREPETREIVDREPVRREPIRREPPTETYTAPKGRSEGKKLFDIKGIANSMPKIMPKTYDTRDKQEDKSSVVFASDIYKKPSNDVERIPQSQSRSQREYNDSLPARDDRIRIPKSAPQRDGTNAVRDREKVLRYIKDHPEGVSFIQMSNDLEIIPNNLTYITKELVINDDIEKVKGLYYYKAHGASADETKSSVVVWRLDGDE